MNNVFDFDENRYQKSLRIGGERLKDATSQDILTRVLGFGSSLPERALSPCSHGPWLDIHWPSCRTLLQLLVEVQKGTAGAHSKEVGYVLPPGSHLYNIDTDPVYGEALGGPDAIPPPTEVYGF
jgi:hypothetical protein